MLTRRLSATSRRLLLAASLLGPLAASAARADFLDIGVPGNLAFAEPKIPLAPITFQMTFTVKNNTGVPLILDYALATITTTRDVKDYVQFAGAGGSNGLGSGDLTIPINGTGTYTYNFVTSVAGPNDDMDFGLNRVDFSIELSKYSGVVPTPNKISSAIGSLFFIDLSPVGEVPNAANLATLKTFTPLGYNQFLYDGTPPGPGNVYFASTNPPQPPPPLAPLPVTSPTVTVVDTPEPASLTLLAGGLAVVLSYVHRHRPGQGAAPRAPSREKIAP